MCDGNLRSTIKALIMANEYLENGTAGIAGGGFVRLCAGGRAFQRSGHRFA